MRLRPMPCAFRIGKPRALEFDDHFHGPGASVTGLCHGKIKMQSSKLILALTMLLVSQSALAQTRPASRPIDPNLPTLWFIGDSTVKNGADTGNNGQWGWGNP